MPSPPPPRGVRPRRRRPVATIVTAVALGLALGLASCGTGAATTTLATEGHDLIVVGRRQPVAQTIPADAVVLVSNRGDLVDEQRLVPDDVWTDAADPRLLRVRFTAGVAPCTGVRLAVDEGPATVRVVLQVGTPHDAIGQMCTAEAATQEVRHALAHPLGSRELIWAEA